MREAQAREVAKMVAEEDEVGEVDLVVVGGDLNSTPGSPVMEILLGAGLKDTIALGGEDEKEAVATYGNNLNTYTGDERGDR